MPVPLPRPIRLFQCYAHKDHGDVQSLVERLKHHLAASTSLRVEIWSDRQILIGTAWDQVIKDAMTQAVSGLLLLSPAALASDYIQRVEIPTLLAASKLLVVGLRPIDFATQLPPALKAIQVFQLKTSGGGERFYTQCRTRQQKDDFALGLYQALHNRLAGSTP